MRILIDTNILINLEDNKIVNQEFYRFYNLAIANNCDILYHKSCLEDIDRDKNLARKQIITSKLSKYSVLPNPAKLDERFSQLVGQKNENDRIDNMQLLQIEKEYVELFVTNDKALKKKAVKIGVGKRVLSSKEAFRFLDEKYTLKIPSHPVLEHGSVRDIENDFTSEFFESLKDDYNKEKFLKWISKCAKENRSCYHLKNEGKLVALLIYKKENYKDNELDNIKEDSIKICTLKVSDDALGMKLGELFLNKMFQTCISQSIKYLYITTYEKQEALIYLLMKFGFVKHKEIINKIGKLELIYLKNLDKLNQSDVKGNQLHPFFRDENNKFVIPIRPEYYTSLFKDANLREPTLFDNEDYGLEEVQGNTIIKAYISNSTRRDLKPGDLLFFYSSQKYKSIEPLGVLIEHKRVDNLEELWNLVKSKTVYSKSELIKWLAERKYLTVTIFRLVQYLKPPIGFKTIENLDVYSNKFQTINKMSDRDYIRIKKHHIDENSIVD